MIGVKRELHAYVDEFDPNGGEKALELMDRLLLVANEFPEHSLETIPLEHK